MASEPDQVHHHALGAHPTVGEGTPGTRFAVWAPNAEQVTVIGDFNRWDHQSHPLRPDPDSGVWSGFVAGVGPGSLYKYHIVSRYQDYRVDKADPAGFHHEVPPRTASVVWDLEYDWMDAAWMNRVRTADPLGEPVSVYEVHLGSWRRGEDDGFLGYRDVAPRLAEYATSLGVTHVELLPVTEHPFYGSWGYQPTGYFAPTSRYGTPQDLMFLIDTLHQAGIGVIIDWVPGHFPADEHGLGFFDGTHLYEHQDPRQGRHPDWGSLIFNYDRPEVARFLQASALFWLDRYHVDGLRVDAVASMLYVDFSRPPGEWIPNVHGGRKNLGAIAFIRELNLAVLDRFPNALLIAEDNSRWPGICRPASEGGLGFSLRWDPSWIHDMLRFIEADPESRGDLLGLIRNRITQGTGEPLLLPISHDEVSKGHGSLWGRIRGSEREAQFRWLLGLLFAVPGKKLLFMGNEFATSREWDHDEALDWESAGTEPHAGIRAWVRELNLCYRAEPSLDRRGYDEGDFRWVDTGDRSGVLAFIRGAGTDRPVLVVANSTDRPSPGYSLPESVSGGWRILLESRRGDPGFALPETPEAGTRTLDLAPYHLVLLGS